MKETEIKSEIKSKLASAVNGIKNTVDSINSQLDNNAMSPNKYNDYKCKKECYEDCFNFISGIVNSINDLLADTPTTETKTKKPLLEDTDMIDAINEKKASK